jgi:hypothetical protein
VHQLSLGPSLAADARWLLPLRQLQPTHINKACGSGHATQRSSVRITILCSTTVLSLAAAVAVPAFRGCSRHYVHCIYLPSLAVVMAAAAAVHDSQFCSKHSPLVLPAHAALRRLLLTQHTRRQLHVTEGSKQCEPERCMPAVCNLSCVQQSLFDDDEQDLRECKPTFALLASKRPKASDADSTAHQRTSASACCSRVGSAAATGHCNWGSSCRPRSVLRASWPGAMVLAAAPGDSRYWYGGGAWRKYRSTSLHGPPATRIQK